MTKYTLDGFYYGKKISADGHEINFDTKMSWNIFGSNSYSRMTFENCHAQISNGHVEILPDNNGAAYVRVKIDSYFYAQTFEDSSWWVPTCHTFDSGNISFDQLGNFADIPIVDKGFFWDDTQCILHLHTIAELL